jgi:uncharacterized protein (DUF952 family)
MKRPTFFTFGGLILFCTPRYWADFLSTQAGYELADLQSRAARRMGVRKRRLSWFGADWADGFLHFSTASQLSETLRLYYAGQNDLMLVAVDATALGTALKWEYSKSREEDFPHLYAALSCDAIKWARPIAKDADGKFVLPDLA